MIPPSNLSHDSGYYRSKLELLFNLDQVAYVVE